MTQMILTASVSKDIQMKLTQVNFARQVLEEAGRVVARGVEVVEVPGVKTGLEVRLAAQLRCRVATVDALDREILIA